MMNPDDVENEEMNGLQSYARKGMAQELAKKLGLLGDVPGIDAEPDANAQGDAQGDAQHQPDGMQTSAGGAGGGDAGLDPELLQQILAALGKGQ